MIWQITAYNGTVWTAKTEMFPEEAILAFLRETKLVRQDIKEIKNLH